MALKHHVDGRDPKLEGYFVGLLIKHREFIVQHTGSGVEPFALSTLISYLALDRVQESTATDFQLKAKYLPEIADPTLSGWFAYFMGLSFWIVTDHATMFRDLHLKTATATGCVDPRTHYLGVTDGGRAKLEAEWSGVVKELGI